LPESISWESKTCCPKTRGPCATSSAPSWDADILPIIEECAYEGRFPKELIPKMAAMNLFGSTISEYGLPGLNNVAYGLVTEELERGDSGLRSFVSVQSSLVMYPIFTYGSKEQKDRWIPALSKGEKIGCFGLTEPDFGSNPRACARSQGRTGATGS